MVTHGVILRAEDRGISIQAWDYARYMQPDRILVVDMGELARGFPIHRDRYPDATYATFEPPSLPEGQLREWFRGLDVCFGVETLYGPDVARWAAEEGCATVIQPNPEFTAPDVSPWVTRWWAPTPWRLSHLPAGTKVVPVPVPDDRFPFAVPEWTGTLRVLHVAGHAAAADRNGTNIVMEAVRLLRGPISVRIISQDEKVRLPRMRCSVPVEVVTGGVANHWDLYANADVIVQPRRYGGLHLPAQEAMASGLALVMSDTEPQRSIWPGVWVRSVTGPPRLQCPGGRLPLTTARPESIASVLNAWALDPEALRRQQEASLEWAERHRWSVMRSTYEAELREAADSFACR